MNYYIPFVEDTGDLYRDESYLIGVLSKDNKIMDLSRDKITDLSRDKITDLSRDKITDLSRDKITDYIVTDRNRSIPGDTVVVKDGVVINVLTRNQTSIPGTLYAQSSMIYGVNARGNYLYRFKPAWPGFPDFYVGAKKYSENHYVTVKFLSWETTQKHPRGCLDKIIGPVGNLVSEYDFILECHQINWPVNRQIKASENTELMNLLDNDDPKAFPERVDLTGLDIYSIDPEGCMDIDDAVSYCSEIPETLSMIGSVDAFQDSSTICIGVHIADPLPFLDPELESRVQHRPSSVYAPHKTINMLPKSLCYRYCSLSPGCLRLARSVIFLIQDGQIIDTRVLKSVIRSRKALSYRKAKIPEEFMELVTCLGRELGITVNDSHDFIEVLMILANRSVARIIAEKVPDSCLLRSHRDPEKTNDIPDDPELSKFLTLSRYHAAEYQLGIKSAHHFGLALDLYTHFTSPIRRYADILVHRQLDESVSPSPDLISIINKTNQTIKRAERDLDLLQFMEQMSGNVGESGPQTLDGYIVACQTHRENYIGVYFPKIKRELIVKVVSRKLSYLTEHTTDSFWLQVQDTEPKIIVYQLYQKIEVEFVYCPKAETLKKKILLRIIA